MFAEHTERGDLVFHSNLAGRNLYESQRGEFINNHVACKF